MLSMKFRCLVSEGIYFRTILSSATSIRCKQNVFGDRVQYYCAQPWLKLLPPSLKNPRFIRKTQVSDQLIAVPETDNYSLAILDGLHASETIDDIFHAFHEVGSDMNEVHIGRAVCRMAEINQQSKQHHSKSEIENTTLVPVQNSIVEQNKGKFAYICQLVLQFSVYMDNQLFLETLNSLRLLGVPVKSSVMQTLLTQSNQRLNDFNPGEMKNYIHCLAKMSEDKNDNLVTALLDSCSILIEKFTEKADNIQQITSVIINLQNRITEEQQQMMLNKLLAIIIIENIDLKSSLFILNALASLNIRKHPVQYKVVDFLMENLNNLDENSTVKLLYQLKACGCVSPKILNSLASNIVDNPGKFSMRNLIHISGIMSTNRFINTEFFQHVANNVVEVDTCFMDLQKIGGIFAALNLSSLIKLADFCDKLLHSAMLTISEDHLDYENCKMICSATASLAQLGCIPDKLLSFINEDKCQNLLFNSKEKNVDSHTRQNLQTLSMLTDSRFPHLESQPPAYHLNSKYTASVDLICSVLNEMFQQKAIKCSVTFTGDVQMNLDFVIEEHASTKKTCLLLAPSTFFVVGSSHLLGMPAAEHSFLTRCGYTVIWIPVHKLEMQKTEEEKRNYLKDILKNIY